ncbi:MAG: DEAD/DEAH box helicase family protein [Mycoplasma sp.]|nr:DEAD/DEAH box helicase family protein [Mycoplasma sp.]
MKKITEYQIKSNLTDESSFIVGNYFYRNGSVKELEIEKINEESFSIFSFVDFKKVHADIDDDEITNFSCNCESFIRDGSFCSHLVALCLEFNNFLNFNDENFSNAENIDLAMIPIIQSSNDNKLINMQLELYFEHNYRKYFISNIEEFLTNENVFFFSKNLYLKKEQFSRRSLEIINDLKKILHGNKTKNFSKKYIDIDELEYDAYFEIFEKYNTTFYFNSNVHWNLTSYIFYSPFDFIEDVKVINNTKKKFIFRTNRNFIFFLLNGISYSYFICFEKNKYEIIIYRFNSEKKDKLKIINDSINNPLSKNAFNAFYFSFKDIFENYSRLISQTFIVRHNILKIDPVLEIEIFFNQNIETIVGVFNYVYGNNRYQYLPNETNYTSRDKFFEENLFNNVFGFFDEYNEDEKVFEISDQGKYLDFLNWCKKNYKNDSYLIKIPENLFFKPKKKLKFILKYADIKNGLLSTKFVIEGMDEKKTQEIIEKYKRKEKYVEFSDRKKINIFKDIDFESFSENLSLLNQDIKNISDCNVLSHVRNSFFINQFNNVQKSDYLEKFLKDFKSLDNTENTLNDFIKDTLKPYQIKGYLWLKKLTKNGMGGILADEMGLGKTVQIISFIEDLCTNEKINLPILIVCPSSLIYNWYKEFKRFAKHINVKICDGNVDYRKELIEGLKENEVLITSYHLLSRDIHLYKEKKFYLQVVDEAQTIKNYYTQFSRDCKSISAIHKFALTGTPIENSLFELWSLFDFIMPGYLLDHNSFKKMFELKILNNDSETISKLKAKISPFIMRRTKKEVLTELPSKFTKIITCEFDSIQKDVYQAELIKSKKEIKFKITSEGIQKTRIFIFAVLTKLRQICCSPKLIYKNVATNGAKFNIFMNLLHDLLENDEKVLVFSQFTSMIDLISAELDKNHIKHFILTGDTNKKKRFDIVNEYNLRKDVKVFLVSLKAGGTGLNLTSASSVIHYDPWWNVSLENQASDRTHRIGQLKNVSVYKFICKDSIEEKIISLQNLKTEMISKILDNENTSSTEKIISVEDALKILDI